MKFLSVPARVCPCPQGLFRLPHRSFSNFGGLVLLLAMLLTAGGAARAQEDNYHYSNLFDITGGLSYMNTEVGPGVTHRGQLPGLDVSATQWLIPRWGAMAEVRGYAGPADANPNKYGVNSPIVTDIQFAVGPQYRWVRRQSFGVNLHALAGGAYGSFDTHLPSGVSGTDVGLYPNGGTFSFIAGPDLDFHRSERYSIRISPGYTATHFGGELQSNFSLSAGLVVHFGRF